jgi:hypothetical protein
LAPEPAWTQRLEEKSFGPAGDQIPVVQSVVRYFRFPSRIPKSVVTNRNRALLIHYFLSIPLIINYFHPRYNYMESYLRSSFTIEISVDFAAFKTTHKSGIDNMGKNTYTSRHLKFTRAILE